MKIKSLFVALAVMVGFCASAQENGTFTLDNITGTPGETVEVEVSMNNVDLSTIAFQCDVVLPSEVQVAVDEYGDADVWTTSRAGKHTITANVIKNDETLDSYILRVVCYSDKNRVITGSDGPVFGFNVKLGETLGDYPVTINNIGVTDENRKEYNDFTCPGATVTIENASSLNSIYGDTPNINAYDLQGRTAPNPSHGLYILNGKKVLVK